jgi:hypothetical protein
MASPCPRPLPEGTLPRCLEGSVEIHSAPGQGTTVTGSVPFEAQD